MKRALPIVLLLTCVLAAHPAEARRRRRPTPKKDPAPLVVGDGDAPTNAKMSSKGKEKVFDFTGLNIEGKLRTPQLLYFLGRARQELERASLESRSFIPEMVRSIDEEGL